MARLNLDDDFFEAVADIAGIAEVDADKVLARAVRFLKLAQERYASGKIITVSEFKARGFLPEFIGILAEHIDDNSIMATHADKRFNWLKQKVDAGRAGGVASGVSRTRDFNELSRSEGEAARSGSNPISISINTNTHLLRKCSPPLPVAEKPRPFPINSFDEFKTALADYHAHWQEIYPDADYLEREAKRAVVWLKANPKKNLKRLPGWVKFFGGWFERDWDKHTTRGPSNPVAAAPDSWDSQASKVIAALKKWYNWSDCIEQVRAYLGEDLHRIAIKAGTYDMRMLRDDQYYKLNIIRRLKDAKEALTADTFPK